MEFDDIFRQALELRRQHGVSNDDPRLINWIRANTNDQARSMDDLATLTQRLGDQRDQEEEKTKVHEAIALNALQGISFGFADEILGGARGVFDPNQTIGESIEAGRAATEKSRQDRPVLSLASEVIGGFAVPGLGGAKALKGAKTFGQGIKRGAAVGGAEGLLFGAGAAEGDPLERIPGALLGAAAGTVGGGLLGGPASALTRKFAKGQRSSRANAAEVVQAEIEARGLRSSDEVLDEFLQRRKVGDFSDLRTGPSTRLGEAPELQDLATAASRTSPEARELARGFVDQTTEIVQEEAARGLKRIDAPSAASTRTRIASQLEEAKRLLEAQPPDPPSVARRKEALAREIDQRPRAKNKAERNRRREGDRAERRSIAEERKELVAGDRQAGRTMQQALTREQRALEAGEKFRSKDVSLSQVRNMDARERKAFRSGVVEDLVRTNEAGGDVSRFFIGEAGDAVTEKLRIALGQEQFDAASGMFEILSSRISLAKKAEAGLGGGVSEAAARLKAQTGGAVRAVLDWLQSSLSFSPEIATARLIGGEFSQSITARLAREGAEVDKLVARGLLGDVADEPLATTARALLDPSTLDDVVPRSALRNLGGLITPRSILQRGTAAGGGVTANQFR